MKIILDTNIVFNNYHFNTPKFIGLFRYTKKTKSKVIIPFYVKQELLKKYKEQLTDYSKETKQSNRILFDKEVNIDVEQLSDEYKDVFTQLIKLGNIEVPEPNNVDSRDIFDRALSELAPFNGGKGIKDTLIWLSVVDILNKNPKEDFCFITANTKDFGAKELLPNLKEDLKENVSRLFYFNSLEEFLFTYGDKIAFIDSTLIDKFFDSEKCEYIISLINKNFLYDSTIEGVPSNHIDSIDNFSLSSLDVHEFYIYSATENFYKVQVDLIVSLDLDITIVDPYDEFGGRSATTQGYTSCYIKISLLINKDTKIPVIDPDVDPIIYYRK